MSRDNTVITNNENKSNNFENKSNKQIEEMAKICHFYDDGICHLCEELLVSCDRKCDLAILVEKLYNAGYRKIEEDPFRRCTCLALGCDIADDLKRDVAEEIFAEIDKVVIRKIIRDGEVIYDVTDEYNELKKKYTEEGKWI